MNITNILVPSDISKASNQLVGFAKSFNANLFLVHINKENKDHSKELDHYCREFKVNNQFTNIQACEIKNKDIHNGLEIFINENKIDLLAMTSHKINFIESIFRKSITEKMIFHSKIPLLVFQS